LQPKTLALMVLCGIAGLAPWLYFPLRSPSAPFGPTDMATWEGFLRHATAQGLRVNLFHFGLVDQLDRLRVFWTLLRLQYAWPLLIVIGVGAVLLPRRKPRQAVLMGLFLLGHLAFTLNSVQDVMAYLLHAFAALAILLGVGGLAVLKAIQESQWHKARLPLAPHQLVAITAFLLLVLPLGTMIYTFPRISLREWDDADVFIAELWERFEGQTETAAFVSDWEHLTPYFYHTYVEGKQVAESDLRPVYVTAAQPWPDSVFGNLPLGPVYLSNYRRDIRQLGFRLRPDGDLWQVLEPPAEQAVTPQYPLDGVWLGEHLQLLGYDLPETTAEQGETVPLILYVQAPVTQSAILMPYVQLGEIEQRWTTDSRRLTPEWLPGEVIAEKYEVLIPYTLLPGNYSLVLRYNDVTAGAKDDLSIGSESSLLLGYIDVLSRPDAKRLAGVLENSLTNIGNEVALRSARVRVGPQMRRGIWERPLPVQGGQVLHLTLTWRALQPPRTSYTVFVHLLDGNGQPVLGYDYTPLGGAFPSYLWFPKWLEGQQVIDPYRLVIPDNLPSGQYWLEVGMYEMGSVRRVPMLAVDGTMTGDRLVLGAVNKE
ncbi:MAG: hypothetical protein JW981_09045, partial [Anaerolineae bacterium]|nr:hypothetical protein [Anaerolineae bacterium]